MSEPKPRGFFQNGEPFREPSPKNAAERRERDPSAFKPRPRCAVCHHPERVRIEALRTAGTPLDRLAEQFDLHRDAIWRHCKDHVSDETKANYLLGPAKVSDLANAAADESRSVIDYLAVVRSILVGQLDRSAAANKPYEVERLAGRLTDVLREIGRITGEVAVFAGNVVNIQNNTQILNSAPFADLQSGLLQICARHPDARADIIALFHDLDARHAAPAAKLIEAREVEDA